VHQKFAAGPFQGSESMNTSVFFHVMAAILITASVFFSCLGCHFFSVVAREVYDQLPQSRWSWFASHSLLLHREYDPDSWLRTKFYFCGVAMLVCGLLAFLFWMK
jgi:hypothetical protein